MMMMIMTTVMMKTTTTMMMSAVAAAAKTFMVSLVVVASVVVAKSHFVLLTFPICIRSPLDPASWEGYDVPVGGWNRGTAASSSTSSNAPSGSSNTNVLKKPNGPLPSPGDILRMNAKK